MNKKSLWIILGILVVLIGLAVCLVFAFLGLYSQSQATTEPQITIPGNETMVSYLKDSWQFADAQWDKATNTITAVRNYNITYEEGMKVGAVVFTDDLAPESYLAQALTIAADLNSRFSTKDITVIISFRSSDNMELFSVDSTGNISTCWN